MKVMREKISGVALGLGLGLSLLCGCAATPREQENVAARELPGVVKMNKDAGRGVWLFVAVRLENGEELPFFLDTGANITAFDKSLEPKLGNRLGTVKAKHYSDVLVGGIYAAPKLFLGGTPLMTGERVFTLDLKSLSADAHRPVMGILGMDCLQHYCIHMDFQANEMRFLDPNQLDTAQLGESFPLTFLHGVIIIHSEGLVEGSSDRLLVDVGNAHDGDLESDFYQQEVRRRSLHAREIPGETKIFGKAWLASTMWNGQTYTSLQIGSGANSIGLRFLARHLVTFNFPHRMMYLKQTCQGPLLDDDELKAMAFLRKLQAQGKTPGWGPGDDGAIEFEGLPDTWAFDFRKDGPESTCHYRVGRVAEDGPWKLEKAWRTDREDRVVEEYLVR